MQASPNTVHLISMMHSPMLIGGKGLESRHRSGKLLILRFTPLGLRRLRLDTTRSSNISSNTISWSAVRCHGGNRVEEGQLAANNPHGMKKGQSVRILVCFQGRLVHQSADSKVSHNETVELLADKFRLLAAQDNYRAPQMGFQFVQGGFDLCHYQ